MKKGFTLVELLIVVVVISILMAITFRLVGIGDDASKRNTTIQRLQKLENCLSGYYAAFGSYPPVPTQGVRQNIYCELDSDGNQTGDIGSTFTHDSVQKACKAQPVKALFPYSEGELDKVAEWSKEAIEGAANKDPAYDIYRDVVPLRAQQEGFTGEPLNKSSADTNWNNTKVFRFGLMSFLLPRYLFMPTIDVSKIPQWEANNEKFQSPNTGGQVSSGDWEGMLKNKGMVSRVYSQAVCARWMPNLEGIVAGGRTFFGINTSAGPFNDSDMRDLRYPGYEDGTLFNGMTVMDGWNREFYYYSPPPFQSYRLWSAGNDGETFPPWVPLDSLEREADKNRASSWMADDIMFLNN